MGSWQPIANLRDYVSQHPPGVTFFLCLLILALSLIVLGSYGHTHTLPNPDITKDWNHFLSSFARHQLCEMTNVTTNEPDSSSLNGQKTDETSLESSSKNPAPVTEYSLLVPLALVHYPDRQTLKGLELHTSLLASQLGLSGDETVIVGLQFFNSADEKTFTCLTISAPEHILPQTPPPRDCPTNERMISPVHVVAMNTESRSPKASHFCYNLESIYDPSLTVMLTQDQQAVAGQHLQQVSVFLLGLCVLLCLSATFFHTRRHQGTGLDLHREPLINSRS